MCSVVMVSTACSCCMSATMRLCAIVFDGAQMSISVPWHLLVCV
jgi:hypothetical protein